VDPEGRSSIWRKVKAWLNNKNDSQDQDLEKEIQELLEEGEARGIISQQESEMIEAVLELGETTSAQIMTPRTSLCTLSLNDNVNDVVAAVVASGHSRIPVYGDDLDHIVGILHAKDLLAHWGKTAADGFCLADIIRQPLFVPQSMVIEQLLAVFNRERTHLAVVVDEYGGTAGVVTMEDVLEEIVGDISDEHDITHTMLSQEPDGSLLADGRLRMEELSEYLNFELPEELPEGRFETVGGFITTLLGRLPKLHEEVVYNHLTMLVEDSDQRKINKVRIFLAQPFKKETQVA
jgi:magnesium and cobalt transporter